jgi:lipoate---protein ligase
MLEVLDTGSSFANENMQIDSNLLLNLGENKNPILHLYEWKKPSISFGYFIDLNKYLNIDLLNAKEIDFARRPTGGGIVFHIWDYAFSFLMPSHHPLFSINTLKNYQLVNQVVLEALNELLVKNKLELTGYTFDAKDPDQLNFCMANPTKYDVIIDNKKVAGAAQRKTKDGFLHQGTISLALPQKEILKEILKNENILPSMLKYSFALLGSNNDFEKLKNTRAQIKKILIQKFQNFINEANY